MNGEPAVGRERARARLAPVLFLSAALVASALAAGLRSGSDWLLELTILLAVAQGLAAGLAFPLLWREGVAPEARARAAGSDRAARGRDPATAPSLARILMGAGGRYVAFVASVGFASVEAHPVGSGLGRGAPPVVLSLLIPPLAVGAFLLRGALVRLPSERGGADGQETR